MELVAVLEGLLFLVGDEGLTSEKIKNILEIDDEKLEELINDLKNTYNEDKRGLSLENLGNNYKITTKKQHKSYYEKLVEVEVDSSLSEAALEVLAIIAYNGPITRAEIDEIRGINSSHLVRKLLLRNLIKDLGKSDSPGRPLLYGVTDDFLDYFGLSSIDELPKIEKKELSDEEKNIFESKYKEQ